MTEQNDWELIEQTRAGDKYAYSELVRRYKSKVAATVFGMIGKCDEAEDIGQEVFIRFYNAINNFRGESAVGTYLCRIAINLSLNEIKRKKVRNFLSFDKMLEDDAEIPDKGNLELFDEKGEIIRNAIAKLSAKYRSVIVLRLIEQYSTEETAKILELPVGTVLSRLARAQAQLKKYLQPYISSL
ncbi:MAG: sigma-70 family RNA polymerase sigma factor [bacterium]